MNFEYLIYLLILLYAYEFYLFFQNSVLYFLHSLTSILVKGIIED